MMRDLGNPFCEVCKMELARRLNNRDYVSRQASVYVCDPEITIPHSRTGTLDRDSDQYRIDEKNITKANGQDLEFRHKQVPAFATSAPDPFQYCQICFSQDQSCPPDGASPYDKFPEDALM